jgi:hypothetical protein
MSTRPSKCPRCGCSVYRCHYCFRCHYELVVCSSCGATVSPPPGTIRTGGAHDSAEPTATPGNSFDVVVDGVLATIESRGDRHSRWGARDQ